MGPRVVLHLGSAAQAPPAGQMSYGAYQVLPYHGQSDADPPVAPSRQKIIEPLMVRLITASQFHPCRRRGSSLLKLIGTHSRCGLRSLQHLVWHHSEGSQKAELADTGYFRKPYQTRDPLTAHRAGGQVAMDQSHYQPHHPEAAGLLETVERPLQSTRGVHTGI